MPYYRRRYRSRWPYRSWRRFGVSRAQAQGTRRFNISIPVDGYGSVGVAANVNNSFVFGVQPFYNSAVPNNSYPEYRYREGNLVTSTLFNTYCGLYDEVKLNSVSFSVAVTSLPANRQSVKVFTAVDRHMNLGDVRTNIVVENMAGTAESSSVMFTSLERAKVSRYFMARDRQEKDTFFDCTLGQRAFSPSAGVSWNMAGPIELLDGNSLYGAFNPLILCGFQLGQAPAADDVVRYQFRVVWNLTFRNPKYGTSSAGRSVSVDRVGESLSTSFQDMKSAVVEEVKNESGVSEGSALRKKVKFEEPVYEESVIPDDESVGMDDESSQPELTREELLEMLKKFEDKKS